MFQSNEQRLIRYFWKKQNYYRNLDLLGADYERRLIKDLRRVERSYNFWKFIVSLIP